MKLVYINDELISFDGSNSHAVGLLHSFEALLGKDNVVSFPKAEDGSGKSVNLKAGMIKAKLKGPLQVVRYVRKSLLSIKRSNSIIRELKEKGFAPTHVLARSTVFDTTAVYVAKAFQAKLIYEFNTPEYFERGVIKKEPLLGAIEKWEKGVISASDFVYINSNICRDMICEHYKISKNKFLVIPNGYMKELYVETEAERDAIRKRVRAAEKLESKFVVTFVGSLKVWHGIKTFCEIAEKMESNDSVRFLVLGDGEMHDLIANYVSNHQNMIFKGKVDLQTMKKYLYSSDLGIMPYEKKENFYYSPLKMFDMIGAGLPFIGTRIGQIEDYCEAKLSTDFLSDSSSGDDFCDMLTHICNDSKTLSEMEAAVQKCRPNDTWDGRARELLERIK